MASLVEICAGIPLDPLPPKRSLDNSVAHAPTRNTHLTLDEEQQALQNALRYFPPAVHSVLAVEFAEELKKLGHIYMHRFRPTLAMKAYPIDMYPSQCRQAAAIMLMIMNNLDPCVAQFPHELVTYGGNGHVFSNWAQFLLVMHYLSIMDESQTLSLYSGHPLGLFPSSPSAPRVVITNGMVIPNYSSRHNFDRMFAMGVTMYGQMTAGSYCYIGPQGIVHGTTITLMHAGRKYLKANSLKGKVFVTAGLGGMSGAQPKAAIINKCIGVVAEVSEEALKKRHSQGWVKEMSSDLDEVIVRIREARCKEEVVSIGYHGNVVDLWEKLAATYAETGERLVDLGSDQTSLHNPFGGGYYPVQISVQEANSMMVDNPQQFKALVHESLCRQVKAINQLAVGGMSFWDYGNAFLLEAGRAGADVFKTKPKEGAFKYPTYVQDIMGDIFSMGFGPFRWICASGLEEDLAKSDTIAADVMRNHVTTEALPEEVSSMYKDNIKWIEEALEHKLVVGSQARILYADAAGRQKIALAFNEAIAAGQIEGPIVLSRDHHDVSGTDSPFRETSNIYDGSAFTADMAVQNCIGDAFRGATWVALHNGGGVGWGEVINGGFGLVLDGSKDAGQRAVQMLAWDVTNGVARRAWCGNSYAVNTIQRSMQTNPGLRVTVPHSVADISIVSEALTTANATVK